MSHDRLCTRLIVYEGDSIAKMYIGNWSDYCHCEPPLLFFGGVPWGHIGNLM